MNACESKKKSIFPSPFCLRLFPSHNEAILFDESLLIEHVSCGAWRSLSSVYLVSCVSQALKVCIMCVSPPPKKTNPMMVALARRVTSAMVGWTTKRAQKGRAYRLERREKVLQCLISKLTIRKLEHLTCTICPNNEASHQQIHMNSVGYGKQLVHRKRRKQQLMAR